MRNENSKPIDWMAAKGLVGNLSPDCYGVIPIKDFKRIGVKHKKETGRKLSEVYKEMAQALGFDSYFHYTDFLKVNGMWRGKMRLNSNRYSECLGWLRGRLAVCSAGELDPKLRRDRAHNRALFLSNFQ